MLPHTTPTTINAISKGETNRYLRTDSNEREFRNRKQRLTNRLLQRGYKHKQILPHINSVKFNQRQKILFRQKPNESKKKLVFVTQFYDDAQRLKQIIKKRLKNNEILSRIFPDPPVISYRNNPSLKQKLVRAKLKPIEETTHLGDTQPDSSIPKHTAQKPPTHTPYLKAVYKILEILLDAAVMHVQYAPY